MLPFNFVEVWKCYFIADELETATDFKSYYTSIVKLCIGYFKNKDRETCLHALENFYQVWDKDTIQQLELASNLEWESDPSLKGHLRCIMALFIEQLKEMEAS